MTQTHTERAVARAEALGYPSLTRALADRLGVDVRHSSVRGMIENLRRGLKTTQSMEAVSSVLAVPLTFWLELDAERFREDLEMSS